MRGKPTVIGICSGAVAGLVAINAGLGLRRPDGFLCHRRRRRHHLLLGLHRAKTQVLSELRHRPKELRTVMGVEDLDRAEPQPPSPKLARLKPRSCAGLFLLDTRRDTMPLPVTLVDRRT
jgi:hypothetical protein